MVLQARKTVMPIMLVLWKDVKMELSTPLKATPVILAANGNTVLVIIKSLDMVSLHIKHKS